MLMPDFKPQDAGPVRTPQPAREWRCVNCGKVFQPGPQQAMPERCKRCDGNVFEASGLFPD
jgi:DNA-directed RNA polymerase subunit RPC12/RpoP